MKSFVWMAVMAMAPSAMFAAPVSTTGVWSVDGNVMGQPVKMSCTIAEADKKLTGSCVAAADNYMPHKVAGTVKAQTVEMHFESDIQGTPISVILTGTLNDEGSKLSGELDVEPMSASGMFVATRQAPVAMSGPKTTPAPQRAAAPAQAAPPAPAPAAPIRPVTGTWKINGDVQGTPVVMTCALAEAAHVLTGTCTGAAGDTTAKAIEGKTTDTTASWNFDTTYDSQPITVFLVGKPNADGTAMSGTLSVAPMSVYGTFDAVKQ